MGGAAGGIPTSRGGPKKNRQVVNAAQCRAGRALLNWTQARLGAEAEVARKTVIDFEHENREIGYRARLAMTVALERAGVIFLWADSDGVEGVWFAKTL